MFSNQESRYNLISLGALHREWFCFNSKGDLMKVFKEAYVMFQAEHVGNVYMLWNSKITIGGLQLSSASKAAVVKQLETTMDSSSDVQLYPEVRLGLGAQQDGPDRYFYGGANSHRSCVNQKDHWVKKFRLVLNLFDLMKM